MSLTHHNERRFLKHLQHATATYLDVSVEYPELLDDLSDPVLDCGDVDVDAEGEVELVVDGVRVAQLLEEHRPLHVARRRRPPVMVCGGGECFWQPNANCWQIVAGLQYQSINYST